jgi:hypothetical protein
VTQTSLFDAPLVPRAPPGAYLSPSGADLKGPILAICEGCGCWIEYQPAIGPCACPTPEVHTWKDPGSEPEEGEEDVDQQQKMELADQLDVVLAMIGEDVDGPAARAAALRLMETEEFATFPAKRGEQVEWMDRLAAAVLTEVGKAPPPQKQTGGVVKEGWDEETQGSTIIRTPIGS